MKEETSTVEWNQDQAPPRKIQLAIEYGLIRLDYTLQDYLIDAIENQGYETVAIQGVQGVKKSSRMLRMAHWIYNDWDAVLESIIFKPSEFVQRLRAIPKGQRTPCLLWDDIGVHYSSSTFKTDIQQYQAIDSAWAAIRTKCNIIIVTIPLIDRLAKNIKDNVTFEVFIGRNQKEMINRIFRLPGLEQLETNFFKATIEAPKVFDPYEVPKDVFKEYWEMRLTLTEEALEKLDSTVESEDMEGWITALEAADLPIGKSANTLQQMASRGTIRGRRINGRFCVWQEDIDHLVEQADRRHRKYV